MSAADRLSLVGGVAAVASGFAITPLTEDRSYLLLAAVLIGASGLIGALLRRVGLGELLVRLVQLVPILALPWFIPETGNPVRLFDETVEFVRLAFAPMPYDVGFAVFSALVLWAVYLLVETLSIGLQSPGWTFPVLILPYAVSALAIYVEANPILFGFTAAGYALVLATSVRHSLQSSRDAAATTVRGWRRGVAAAAVGSTGLALVGMMLLSWPIPERSADWGAGGTNGTVQLGDPSLDLIRNVNSNSSQTLLTYRTSDGGGHYLRLAALPVFDEQGFHLTPTDLVPLPLPADRPAFRTQTVRTSVEVREFASEYLPTPWLPTEAQTTGDWRYDPRTLAIVAVGDARRSATRNLAYEVTSERLPAVERLLARAGAGAPADNGLTLSLPPAISPAIRELAEQVTADADTAGAKALALRDYLRSGVFQYSTIVTPGTTLQTLDDFLLGSRVGYCEQFAGSLAVMARMVGIPSRVVVGFLPGTQTDEEWEVSAKNMHAWTELYFGDDIGWVPLDATPAGAVSNPEETATASPGATEAPVTQSPTAPTAAPSDEPVTPDGSTVAAPPSAWAVGGGALALAAAVAGGPLLVRQVLRRRRLAGSTDPARAAEDAWSEVRAIALDRGADWPLGSTRQVAAALTPELDPDGAAELRELAILVEQARFAAAPPEPVNLRRRVLAIQAAMEKRWDRPTAWTRRWWPRSLWPQRPSS